MSKEKVDLLTFSKKYFEARKFKPLQYQIDFIKAIQAGHHFVIATSFFRQKRIIYNMIEAHRDLIDRALNERIQKKKFIKKSKQWGTSFFNKSMVHPDDE